MRKLIDKIGLGGNSKLSSAATFPYSQFHSRYFPSTHSQLRSSLQSFLAKSLAPTATPNNACEIAHHRPTLLKRNYAQHPALLKKKQNNNYKGLFFITTLVAFLFIILISLVSAVTSSPGFSGSMGGEFSSGGSYSSFSVQSFTPGFAGASVGLGGYGYYGVSPAQYQEMCRERQDFVVQIAPGGCTPAVVRSDLLAEQNVPVFCQIDALEINPLVDIKEIRNIRFSGKYPDDVVGAGFHPASAAL